jgi:hypothetical protein
MTARTGQLDYDIWDRKREVSRSGPPGDKSTRTVQLNGQMNLDRSAWSGLPGRADETNQKGQVSLTGQTRHLSQDSSTGKGQPEKVGRKRSADNGQPDR